MKYPEEGLNEPALRPMFFVVATLAAAVILALAGFGLGWFLSGRQVAGLKADPPPIATTTATRPETDLPETDVPGKDFPDLPRYPGSVRVEYQRRASAGLLVVDTEYVVSARLDDVREFYRNVFRNENWKVAGFNVSEGEWDFFVIKGKREAVIEIEPQAGAVEIEIEVSKPRKDGLPQKGSASQRRSGQPTLTPSPQGDDDFGDDYDDDFDEEFEDD